MYWLPMDNIENNQTLLGDINMELHGNPSLIDCIRGKALSLNGIDQYADISHHRYGLNMGTVYIINTGNVNEL